RRARPGLPDAGVQGLRGARGAGPMSIVVAGYGMAGARFAAELRARSDEAKLTVLGAEPEPAYNRILLSSVLAGKLREPDLALVGVAGRGIDVRTGVQVVAIDRTNRTVTVDTGEQVPYQHLV